MFKRGLMKKALSAVITMAMVFSPVSAFAEEPVSSYVEAEVETVDEAEVEEVQVSGVEEEADTEETLETVDEELAEETGVVEESVGAAAMEAAGALETIYAELSGVTASQVSAVEYTATSGGKSGSLTAEDIKYLVRADGSGVRIDIPGVKAGTYTLKVTTAGGSVTKEGIEVTAYDRSGYAHYKYTDGVGAYNDDGTLKDNAVVLYVTDENKNTVSLTVGSKTVTGIGNILNTAGSTPKNGGAPNTNNGIMKDLAIAGKPLAVRIIGTVKNLTNTSDPSSTALINGLTVYDSSDNGGTPGDNGGMARMKDAKDVTIEGIGTDAVVDGWGFHFMCGTGAPQFGKSFEVRNVSFKNTPEDAVGMEGVQGVFKADGVTVEGGASASSDILASVERCWIHNNEFYGPNFTKAAESDKTEGDGSCDFKRGQYLTVAYNYFEGCHKTNLVGSSDSSLQFNLTYHHNYWYLCKARGPLTRRANVHMYNNFIFGQTDYAMNTRAEAYIFSESNIFYMCKSPQAVEAGAIKSYNDSIGSFLQNKGSVATVVTDKNEKVANNCQFSYRKIDYSSFDTNKSLSYIPDNNYQLQEDLVEARKTIEAYTGVQKETFVKPSEVKMADISVIDEMGAKPVSIASFPFSAAPGKLTKAMYAFTTPAKSDVTITMDSSSAYDGVLVNEAGVAYAVVKPGTTGTAYGLPAGSYAIQPMLFQPGDSKKMTLGTWKEMNVAAVKVENADPNYDPEKLTGLEMNMSSKTLLVGGTVNLSAKKVPVTAKTDSAVVWTSSNTAVATVNNGVVTAVSKGKTTITATLAGISTTCQITVSEPIAITGAILSTESVTVTAGQKATITVSPMPANTTDEYEVKYVSADANVATVDSNGSVTGVKEGTTKITATVIANPDNSGEDGTSAAKEYSVECEVTVLKGKELPTGDNIINFTALGEIKSSGIYTVAGSAAKATAITYEGVNLTDALKLNDKGKITFTTAKAGKLIVIAGRKAINLDGTKVALTANGVIESNIAAGSHTIAKSKDGESWIYAVLFVPEGESIGGGDSDVDVTSVTLDKETAGVEVGKTVTLTAVVAPENATVKNVNWTSSNPAVATVKNGVVTGVADGIATITATSVSNPACSDSCVVTVGNGQGGEEPDPGPTPEKTTVPVQFSVVTKDGTPSYSSLEVEKTTTIAGLLAVCAPGKTIVGVAVNDKEVNDYAAVVTEGAKYLITYKVVEGPQTKTAKFDAAGFIVKAGHSSEASNANFTDAEKAKANDYTDSYFKFAGTLRWIKGKTDLIALGDPNTALDGSVSFTTENAAVLTITAVGAGVNSTTKIEQKPTVYVKDASGKELSKTVLPATGTWTDAACNIKVELPTAGTYTITHEDFQARINTIEVVETIPVTNDSIRIHAALVKDGDTADAIYNAYDFAKTATVADLVSKIAAGREIVSIVSDEGGKVADTEVLKDNAKYVITYKVKAGESGDPVDPGKEDPSEIKTPENKDVVVPVELDTPTGETVKASVTIDYGNEEFDHIYDGKPKKPFVTVILNGEEVPANCYKLSYKNNKNADMFVNAEGKWEMTSVKPATIYVKFKGEYKGYKVDPIEFAIYPAKLSPQNFEIIPKTKKDGKIVGKSGRAFKPIKKMVCTFESTNKSKTLKLQKDIDADSVYFIPCIDSTYKIDTTKKPIGLSDVTQLDAGYYMLRVSGINNYYGTCTDGGFQLEWK